MENRNKVFDPQIKQFDEETAKKELKNCPKIVQDYFKLIEQQAIRWKELCLKSISKLKTESKSELRKYPLEPPNCTMETNFTEHDNKDGTITVEVSQTLKKINNEL